MQKSRSRGLQDRRPSSGSRIKDIINGRTVDRHTYVRSECLAINTAVAAERRTRGRGSTGEEGGWRLNKISILCYEGHSSIEAEHARVHATLAATTAVRLSRPDDALNGNDP